MTDSAPSPVLDVDAMMAIGRALADPRRYAILMQLAGHVPGTPCAVVRECMEISPATLSHHMRELRLAGLVGEVREGRNVSYVLRREVMESYLRQLGNDLL